MIFIPYRHHGMTITHGFGKNLMIPTSHVLLKKQSLQSMIDQQIRINTADVGSTIVPIGDHENS